MRRPGAVAVGGAVALSSLLLATFLLATLLLDSSSSPIQLAQIQPEVIYLSPAQAQQQLKAEANAFLPSQEPMLAEAGQEPKDNVTSWNGYRSCGIYDLVAQARAVFPYWDRCGYMLEEADGLRMKVAGFGSARGVISAPTDDLDCTPNKLSKKPCKQEMVRTLAYNDENSLKDCLLKIPGLSQTCDLYANCGPQPEELFVSMGTTSVCAAPEGGFYREPEVQRMCGICQMFHATTGLLAETPDDPGTGKDEDGGCLAEGQAITVLRGDDILHTRIEDVVVGDRVLAGGDDQGRRVYFVHSHKQPKKTVTLHWAEEGSQEPQGSVELTGLHQIPVTSGCTAEACAQRTVPAGWVRPGDKLFMADGTHKTVVRVSKGFNRVRQLLVEGESLVVSRTWVSVWSSPLRSLETIPFRALEFWWPRLLQWQPVASVIARVLDSPAVSTLGSGLSKLVNGTPQLASHCLNQRPDGFLSAVVLK